MTCKIMNNSIFLYREDLPFRMVLYNNRELNSYKIIPVTEYEERNQ